MRLIPQLLPLSNPSELAEALPELLLNAQSESRSLQWLQKCLGLQELDRLYAIALSERRERESFCAALLRLLDVTWSLSPLDLQRIPKTGGALVVANHPFGLVEGVVLKTVLEQVRPDSRILANALLGRFPELASSLFFVNPFGGDKATWTNRQGLKEALAFLKQGGILGVFPAGEVASMDVKRKQVVDPHWSHTVARLARLAQVPVLPLFFAGRNGTAFQMAGLLHPRFRTALLIREFLNKTGKRLDIRIGNLVPARKLQELHSDRERIEYLRRKTYILANRQAPRQPRPFLVPLLKKPHAHPSEPALIVAPTNPVLMETEIAALDSRFLLSEQGENAVYCASANQLPNVVREIGRLRETTFRAVGEGTGKPIDLDEFDTYYQHLFIWNRTNREIVGAYRIGQSDLILKNFGTRGFYTSTLFAYRRQFLERIHPALELGRSFVRPEYQKSYAPLLLLWKGIGAYVCRHPQYKNLFGPVSISNDYGPGSKQLIVNFLKEYCQSEDLSRFVRARSPFRTKPLKYWESHSAIEWDIEELSALIADMETDQKGVPILLKQYLKLGGKLIGFNVDPAFSSSLDGLVIVELAKTDGRLLERYLGKEGSAGFLAYHRAASDTVAAAQ
jgi:putative hemolysin